jgi:uncharacterized delta-60 repeat protein
MIGHTLTVAFVLLLLAAVGRAAEGDLDLTYGNGGRALLELGSSNDEVNSLFALPDGSAILAGQGQGSTVGAVVAKLTPQGARDLNFGVGGVRTIPGSGFGGFADLANDGSTIVGYYHTLGVSQPTFRLARVLGDGALDPAFAVGPNNGVPVTHSSRIQGMKIQPDGRVLVIGMYSDDLGGDSDWLLARFEPDGTVDSGFGVNGVVLTDFASPEFPTASDVPFTVKVDDQGRVLVGGYTTTTNAGIFTHAVARYLPDGMLDPTFAVAGQLKLGFDLQFPHEAVTDIEILHDGNLLLASSGGSETGLFKLRPDGSLATEFGDAGRLTFATSSPFREPQDLLIDPAGRILVAGVSLAPAFSPTAFAVGRLLSDGGVDMTFAAGGLVNSFGNPFSEAEVLAIQPDGNLLVGGRMGRLSPTNRVDGVVARFELTQIPEPGAMQLACLAIVASLCRTRQSNAIRPAARAARPWRSSTWRRRGA